MVGGWEHEISAAATEQGRQTETHTSRSAQAIYEQYASTAQLGDDAKKPTKMSELARQVVSSNLIRFFPRKLI